MSLLELANELLLSVAENLIGLGDLNAFARTNKRLYFLLNDYLYRLDVQQSRSSALFWAAEHGQEETARRSLAEGADCEATRDNRQPIALRRGPFNSGMLVKHTFDVLNSRNAQMLTRLTPLQLAVCRKQEFVARLLIQQGADIRKTYPEPIAKCTVLHLASAYGLTDIVELLLAKGAELEARDDQGMTPLHYAVDANRFRSRRYENVKTAFCLLEKGARYSTRDRSGRKPKDLANKPVWGSRWSEQEQENDERAEKGIKRLFEAKEAERLVKKWDSDHELRKKRIAAEKASQERRAKSKSERILNDRLRREQAAVEARRAQEKAEEVRLGAQRKVEADLQEKVEEAEKAVLAEISRRERQEAARKNWSQLREQAEQRTQTLGNSTVIVSPGCTHSPIGWMKQKTRAQCRMCDKTCVKYSFQCADCGFVACTHCKTVS
jgi:ankyrin repeat protein